MTIQPRHSPDKVGEIEEEICPLYGEVEREPSSSCDFAEKPREWPGDPDGHLVPGMHIGLSQML
jgi:hypothetical protein